MSEPYEWRINDIERSTNEANRRLHELDTLRSNVDRVEWNVPCGSLAPKLMGYASALEAANQRIEHLEQQMGEVLSFISNKQVEHE